MRKSKTHKVIGNSLAFLSLTSQMTMAMQDDRMALLFRARGEMLATRATTDSSLNSTRIDHANQGFGSSNESVKEAALESSLQIFENKNIISALPEKVLDLCKKAQPEVQASTSISESVKEEMQIRIVESLSNIEKTGLPSTNNSEVTEMLSYAYENVKKQAAKEKILNQSATFIATHHTTPSCLENTAAETIFQKATLFHDINQAIESGDIILESSEAQKVINQIVEYTQAIIAETHDNDEKAKALSESIQLTASILSDISQSDISQTSDFDSKKDDILKSFEEIEKKGVIKLEKDVLPNLARDFKDGPVDDLFSIFHNEEPIEKKRALKKANAEKIALERTQKKAEREAKRIAAEKEADEKAERETKRIAAEKEAAEKKAAEEEAEREVETKRIAAEKERLEKETAEKKAAEEEAEREVETKRIAAEKERIEKEAAEEKAEREAETKRIAAEKERLEKEAERIAAEKAEREAKRIFKIVCNLLQSNIEKDLSSLFSKNIKVIKNIPEEDKTIINAIHYFINLKSQTHDIEEYIKSNIKNATNEVVSIVFLMENHYILNPKQVDIDSCINDIQTLIIEYEKESIATPVLQNLGLNKTQSTINAAHYLVNLKNDTPLGANAAREIKAIIALGLSTQPTQVAINDWMKECIASDILKYISYPSTQQNMIAAQVFVDLHGFVGMEDSQIILKSNTDNEITAIVKCLRTKQPDQLKQPEIEKQMGWFGMRYASLGQLYKSSK